ncbi:unnamed protein product [Urochloa humidicola]
MAAMRSALAILGHRSLGSGSSAAASMGGRGLLVHRPAVPRMPPRPSLLPAAVRNLEGWRRYSSEGREPTEKAEGVLRMWWRRWRDHMRNMDPVERVTLYALVVLGGPMIYRMKS